MVLDQYNTPIGSISPTFVIGQTSSRYVLDVSVWKLCQGRSCCTVTIVSDNDLSLLFVWPPLVFALTECLLLPCKFNYVNERS